MPKALESLEDKGSAPESKDSKTPAKGPPPTSPKPRSASDSSLYSTAGKAGMSGSMQGLGAEGSSPALIGMQGLTLVQRGIQMMNLAFPDNPGLTAVLADLTGRLQTLIPQMVSQAANMSGGGMMGMMMQQPGMMPGQSPMGAPPMGGMPAPPMQPGAPAGPMAGPAGPPVPPRPPIA